MPEDLRRYRIPAALPEARRDRLLSVLTDAVITEFDRIRPRAPETSAIAAVILGAQGGFAPTGRVEVRAALNIDQSCLRLDDDGWSPRDDIQYAVHRALDILVPDEMEALGRTVPALHRRGAILPASIAARHRVFVEITADISNHARIGAISRMAGL